MYQWDASKKSTPKHHGHACYYSTKQSRAEKEHFPGKEIANPSTLSATLICYTTCNKQTNTVKSQLLVVPQPDPYPKHHHSG